MIYLPAGWKHLTLNVGEAIGVGGQVAYDPRQRLVDGKAALQRGAGDLLAAKGAALSLVHEAMALPIQQEKRAKQALHEAIDLLQRSVDAAPAHPEIAMLTAGFIPFRI